MCAASRTSNGGLELSSQSYRRWPYLSIEGQRSKGRSGTRRTRLMVTETSSQVPEKTPRRQDAKRSSVARYQSCMSGTGHLATTWRLGFLASSLWRLGVLASSLASYHWETSCFQ